MKQTATTLAMLLLVSFLCSGRSLLAHANDSGEPRSSLFAADPPKKDGCDDDLRKCEKKVRTHKADKDGCMPVECKADTKEAYYLFVKDQKAKAWAAQLEKESWPLHDGRAK